MQEEKRKVESKILGLESDLKLAVEAKQTLEEERDHYKSEMSERAKERDRLRRTIQELEDQMKDFKRVKGDLTKLKLQVGDALKRVKEANEGTQSQLSCLSCLDYLEDPLMLLCGHSICSKCFRTHSDPNSKDSIVFCEECKIETKNKLIKD